MTAGILISATACALVCSAMPTLGVHLDADTNRPSTSTFSVGEDIQAKFTVSGIAPNQAASIVVSVADVDGVKQIPDIERQITGSGATSTSITVDLPSAKLGYFTVSAKLNSTIGLPALGSKPSGFISYAVVYPPSDRKDFGANYSHFGLQGGFNKNADILPYLGARYVLNGWPEQWAKEEADGPNEFHPQSLPKVSQNSGWHTYTIARLTAQQIPSWAIEPGTQGNGGCSRFGALNDKGRKALPGFASNFAMAFSRQNPSSSVRYYQITWEPFEKTCFNGTDEELIDFYRYSYSAIHDADPNAIIVGPTLLLTNSAQLRRLLEAGLGKYIDGFSLHTYQPGNGKEALFPPESNGFVGLLRSQLAVVRSYTNPNIPFIGTEHSFRSAEVGDLNKAEGDVRETIIMLGEGAKVDVAFYAHDYWDDKSPPSSSKGYGFYWNLNPAIRFGSDKLAPKPIVPAYSAMTYFLDGTTTAGPYTRISGSQIGYVFNNGTERILTAWDYNGKSAFTLPSGAARICDWMGNCTTKFPRQISLGPTPTYIFF